MCRSVGSATPEALHHTVARSPWQYWSAMNPFHWNYNQHLCSSTDTNRSQAATVHVCLLPPAGEITWTLSLHPCLCSLRGSEGTTFTDHSFITEPTHLHRLSHRRTPRNSIKTFSSFCLTCMSLGCVRGEKLFVIPQGKGSAEESNPSRWKINTPGGSRSRTTRLTDVQNFNFGDELGIKIHCCNQNVTEGIMSAWCFRERAC